MTLLNTLDWKPEGQQSLKTMLKTEFKLFTVFANKLQ